MVSLGRQVSGLVTMSVLLREGSDDMSRMQVTHTQTCCYILRTLSMPLGLFLFSKRHCTLYPIPRCPVLFPWWWLLLFTSMGTTYGSESFPDRKILKQGRNRLLLLVPTQQKEQMNQMLQAFLSLANKTSSGHTLLLLYCRNCAV